MAPRKKKTTVDPPSVFPEHDLAESIKKSVDTAASNQLEIVKLLENHRKALNTIVKQMSTLLQLTDAMLEHQLSLTEEIEEDEAQDQAPTVVPVESPAPVEPHPLANTFNKLRQAKIVI